MEIQSLKLFLTDADLAALGGQLLAEHDTIEELQLHFTPEGVLLQGQYPTGFGFKVPFETLWQLTPEGPLLRVHLATVKVGGVPAGILRGALLRMARDAIEQ